MADRGQALPGGGVGQQLVGTDDAGAVQVGVGKEQVVIALQRVGLAEEGVKAQHRALRPGQGLLINAAHVGGVLIVNMRCIGKNVEGAVTVRQEICLEVGVKIMPEHRVGAGADIQDGESFHKITTLFASLACEEGGPEGRREGGRRKATACGRSPLPEGAKKGSHFFSSFLATLPAYWRR